MRSTNPAFSVEVDGKVDFFDTEADAEKFAEPFVCTMAKSITITNLGVPPDVAYTHKYWSHTSREWIKVFPAH